MKISVIIPTLNAGKYIEKLLTMLMSQEAVSPEIIIIDSSSKDDTIKIARRFPTKTMSVPQRSFNHGRTRNVAAEAAKGDILVFMTQDAVPVDEKLLGNLTKPLSMPGIAATFGRHVARPDASPLEKYMRRFNYPEKGLIKGIEDLKEHGMKTFFFSNVCSAIRKAKSPSSALPP